MPVYAGRFLCLRVVCARECVYVCVCVRVYVSVSVAVSAFTFQSSHRVQASPVHWNFRERHNRRAFKRTTLRSGFAFESGLCIIFAIQSFELKLRIPKVDFWYFSRAEWKPAAAIPPAQSPQRVHCMSSFTSCPAPQPRPLDQPKVSRVNPLAEFRRLDWKIKRDPQTRKVTGGFADNWRPHC